jgi:putative tricarboxylic transport membrane protein
MVRQNAGLWAAIVVLLCGAVFFGLSLSFDYYGSSGPGPGFLPLWLSGLLIVLSSFYIADSIRHVVKFKDILPDRTGLVNIMTIAGAFLLLLLTIKFLGFVTAGTLFMFILLFKEYKWYTGLGISILVTLILFWVFVDLLKVPIPLNDWGW